MPPFTLTPRRSLRRIVTVLVAVGAWGWTAGQTTVPADSGNVITNDVFYKDTDGNPIWSQGGGIFKFGDTYYWYGVKYNGAVTYYNDPSAGMVTGSGFNAVTCYSSTDLVHWKFENNILSTSTPGVNRPGWVGRLGVVYNQNTQKYVLITQYSSRGSGGGELFATCDTPAGNFTFDHVQHSISDMVNNRTGDQTVFVDTDGKAYLICCNAMGRSHLYVCPLRPSDYLNVDAAVQVSEGPGREGNCLFKYHGRYYFCSSDLHGWNASPCHVIDAASIYGPYSDEYTMAGTEADFCHVTQTGFFVTVEGSAATTVLFCGDRWSDFAGNGLGYNEWCPLSFNGPKPQFHSVSQFNFDAATGLWSVGPKNNYVLNPSFEADRVAQSRLAGWVNSPDDDEGGPNRNSPDAHTGRWSMNQYAESDYTANMTQTVKDLPNGTYTLQAWVKSSGSQPTAEIFARNYGGDELDAAINQRLANWTQVTIPHITVTTGQCEIGVHSDANAKDWVEADDFSLIKN
jgi:hypothetical protein